MLVTSPAGCLLRRMTSLNDDDDDCVNVDGDAIISNTSQQKHVGLSTSMY